MCYPFSLFKIKGTYHSYIANETPMITYMNIYTALEDRRQRSLRKLEAEPRVILVGPTDSGKSSIARILLSYAARRGHEPTYVDLDVGQGSITVPGAVAAVPVDLPVPVEVSSIVCT